MADQLTSSGGTNSAIVPEKWSSNFQDNFRNKVVYNSIIAREYENEIQDMGDTVRIPTLPDVTAVDVAEGSTVDAVASTATTSSLVINTQTSVHFKITKRAELQSVPFIDELEERAISAIALQMQSNITSAIVPSAATPDHQIAYDAANTLADADLLEALDLEKTANWPDEGRWITTGGAQYNDLVAITKFADKDTNLGSSPTATGKITEPIYGHMVDWTTALGNTTNIFHNSFMQMAVQDSLEMKLHDIGVNGERGFRLNVDILYGILQVHDDRVIQLT